MNLITRLGYYSLISISSLTLFSCDSPSELELIDVYENNPGSLCKCPLNMEIDYSKNLRDTTFNKLEALTNYNFSKNTE